MRGVATGGGATSGDEVFTAIFAGATTVVVLVEAPAAGAPTSAGTLTGGAGLGTIGLAVETGMVAPDRTRLRSGCRVLGRELHRGAKVLQRLGRFSLALVNVGQRPDGGEILRRGTEDVLEHLTRLVELTDFHQRSTQGHTRRQIGRMPLQAGPAGLDGLTIAAGATELLRQRRKRDRRRVRQDPTSKFFNARIVRHGLHLRER